MLFSTSFEKVSSFTKEYVVLMDCKVIAGNVVNPDLKYGMHLAENETKGENRATARVKITLLTHLLPMCLFSTP